MDISGEILARKRPVFDKAAAFGFVPVSGDNDALHDLVYREEIMDGELTAEAVIRSDGTVKCRVIETDTGDEYGPLNIDAYTGKYVGSVREAFRDFLELIAENCFEDVPRGLRRHAAGKAYWIIPSNPKNYNVAEGFRNSRDHIIPWHHRINVMPGDIVYIYQTEPVAAIMFRCEVVSSFLPRPSSWSWLAPASKYRMDLRLLETFDKDVYPRKWMNEHGIKKTVRGQRSAPPELVREIEKSK